MFTGSTRDISGVNPKGEAAEGFISELSSIVLINTYGSGLLYHCRHANYYHAVHLYCVLFFTKPEHSAEQLLAADPSYCWLYPSKANRRLLHAFRVPLPCSSFLPPGTLSQARLEVLAVDPSAHDTVGAIDRDEYE